MACDFISAGRALSCKDASGGLKNVYFSDSEESAWTIDALTDEVDAVVGGPLDVYKYELKGTSTFEQTINSSRDNGTSFVEQTLTLSLQRMSAADNKAIKLLTWNNPRVLVEDYNGNVFLMGVENGADVSGGTIATGAAMGDFNGYTLTLSAMERVPAHFLVGSLASDLIDEGGVSFDVNPV